MTPRLQGKSAIVIGGGQTPGETVGNGRATALTFGREGARVLVVDRELARAQQTADEIVAAGGDAWALAADVTDEGSVVEMIRAAREAMPVIDVLHYNVGISLAGGDAVLTEIEMAAFARVTETNLTGMVAVCKHIVPVMRAQGHGVILGIGSLASVIDYPYIAYKTSKAGLVALVENLAVRFAPDGIRANAILPGLMETPMAIENRIGIGGQSREDVVRERNSRVPLGHRMGSGWDVANAALFLASDEAQFVTGVALRVDGGQSLVVG